MMTEYRLCPVVTEPPHQNGPSGTTTAYASRLDDALAVDASRTVGAHAGYAG